jgi:Protein of unknown function, DUF624
VPVQQVQQVSRGERARETVRRASECALLGAVWLLFSLPVVTSGAAWLAVARVCTAWAHDIEPPLLRTFASTVRHRFGTGLALQLLAAGIAVVPYLELRVALAARVPGAPLEAAALAVLAAVGLAVALLAVPGAAAGLSAGAALRAAVPLLRRAPWAGVAAVGALAAGAAIVYLLPVLAVIMAGPVGFAISAVWIRAANPT